MSTLLTSKVLKTPSAEVSADRYVFLKLSEAEPDLGLPSVNGYVLSSTTTGTRSWIAQAAVAGTDGQITYNNGGTSAGAASLYYDDVTGRLGINTVVPMATLDVAGDITVNSNVNLNSEAIILATTVKTQIASFALASFRSGKLIVQAYDSVTGEVQISELLIAHNGTIASATEYGVVYTGSISIVTYDVDITGPNVRLMATRASENSTQYKISETLIVA